MPIYSGIQKVAQLESAVQSLSQRHFQVTTDFLLLPLVTVIHYHLTYMKGHVCVAGDKTSLNMATPAATASQRYV